MNKKVLVEPVGENPPFSIIVKSQCVQTPKASVISRNVDLLPKTAVTKPSTSKMIIVRDNVPDYQNSIFSSDAIQLHTKLKAALESSDVNPMRKAYVRDPLSNTYTALTPSASAENIRSLENVLVKKIKTPKVTKRNKATQKTSPKSAASKKRSVTFAPTTPPTTAPTAGTSRNDFSAAMSPPSSSGENNLGVPRTKPLIIPVNKSKSISVLRSNLTALDEEERRKVAATASVASFLKNDTLDKNLEVLDSLDDPSLTFLVTKVMDAVNKMYGDYLEQELTTHLGPDKYRQLANSNAISTYREFLAKKDDAVVSKVDTQQQKREDEGSSTCARTSDHDVSHTSKFVKLDARAVEGCMEEKDGPQVVVRVEKRSPPPELVKKKSPDVVRKSSDGGKKTSPDVMKKISSVGGMKQISPDVVKKSSVRGKKQTSPDGVKKSSVGVKQTSPDVLKQVFPDLVKKMSPGLRIKKGSPDVITSGSSPGMTKKRSCDAFEGKNDAIGSKAQVVRIRSSQLSTAASCFDEADNCISAKIDSFRKQDLSDDRFTFLNEPSLFKELPEAIFDLPDISITLAKKPRQDTPFKKKTKDVLQVDGMKSLSQEQLAAITESAACIKDVVCTDRDSKEMLAKSLKIRRQYPKVTPQKEDVFKYDPLLSRPSQSIPEVKSVVMSSPEMLSFGQNTSDSRSSSGRFQQFDGLLSPMLKSSENRLFDATPEKEGSVGGYSAAHLQARYRQIKNMMSWMTSPVGGSENLREHDYIVGKNTSKAGSEGTPNKDIDTALSKIQSRNEPKAQDTPDASSFVQLMIQTEKPVNEDEEKANMEVDIEEAIEVDTNIDSLVHIDKEAKEDTDNKLVVTTNKPIQNENIGLLNDISNNKPTKKHGNIEPVPVNNSGEGDAIEKNRSEAMNNYTSDILSKQKEKAPIVVDTKVCSIEPRKVYTYSIKKSEQTERNGNVKASNKEVRNVANGRDGIEGRCSTKNDGTRIKVLDQKKQIKFVQGTLLLDERDGKFRVYNATVGKPMVRADDIDVKNGTVVNINAGKQIKTDQKIQVLDEKIVKPSTSRLAMPALVRANVENSSGALVNWNVLMLNQMAQKNAQQTDLKPEDKGQIKSTEKAEVLWRENPEEPFHPAAKSISEVKFKKIAPTVKTLENVDGVAKDSSPSPTTTTTNESQKIQATVDLTNARKVICEPKNVVKDTIIQEARIVKEDAAGNSLTKSETKNDQEIVIISDWCNDKLKDASPTNEGTEHHSTALQTTSTTEEAVAASKPSSSGRSSPDFEQSMNDLANLLLSLQEPAPISRTIFSTQSGISNESFETFAQKTTVVLNNSSENDCIVVDEEDNNTVEQQQTEESLNDLATLLLEFQASQSNLSSKCKLQAGGTEEKEKDDGCFLVEVHSKTLDAPDEDENKHFEKVITPITSGLLSSTTTNTSKVRIAKKTFGGAAGSVAPLGSTDQANRSPFKDLTSQIENVDDVVKCSDERTPMYVKIRKSVPAIGSEVNKKTDEAEQSAKGVSKTTTASVSLLESAQTPAAKNSSLAGTTKLDENIVGVKSLEEGSMKNVPEPPTAPMTTSTEDEDDCIFVCETMMPITNTPFRTNLEETRRRSDKLRQQHRRNLLRKKVLALSRTIRNRIRDVRVTFRHFNVLVNLINSDIKDTSIDTAILMQKLKNLDNILSLVTKPFVTFKREDILQHKNAFRKLCMQNGGGSRGEFLRTRYARSDVAGRRREKEDGDPAASNNNVEEKFGNGEEPIPAEAFGVEGGLFEEMVTMQPMNTYIKSKENTSKNKSDFGANQNISSKIHFPNQQKHLQNIKLSQPKYEESPEPKYEPLFDQHEPDGMSLLQTGIPAGKSEIVHCFVYDKEYIPVKEEVMDTEFDVIEMADVIKLPPEYWRGIDAKPLIPELVLVKENNPSIKNNVPSKRGQKRKRSYRRSPPAKIASLEMGIVNENVTSAKVDSTKKNKKRKRNNSRMPPTKPASPEMVMAKETPISSKENNVDPLKKNPKKKRNNSKSPAAKPVSPEMVMVTETPISSKENTVDPLKENPKKKKNNSKSLAAKPASNQKKKQRRSINNRKTPAKKVADKKDTKTPAPATKTPRKRRSFKDEPSVADHSYQLRSRKSGINLKAMTGGSEGSN